MMMAWTTPATVTANTALTAAYLNTHLRDNMLETMPGKARTPGSWWVSDGTSPKSITERTIAYDRVEAMESTKSSTFTDLSTPGPVVTVDHGTRALVISSARMYNAAVDAVASMSWAMSGDNTRAALDDTGVNSDGILENNRWHGANFDFLTTLTVGTTTFTAKYKCSGIGGSEPSFGFRQLIVWPF